MTPDPARPADLDRWPVADLEPALLACLASPPWARALIASRPHGKAAEWLAAADAAYTALPDEQVLDALAAHPRIGAAPSGPGADARASRREQAAVAGADEDVRAALAAGNQAYEERFGRVFLIRAAGRGPEEILAELRRRLANDDATELGEAREELRQITVLRLERMLGVGA